MSNSPIDNISIKSLDIPLERDIFLRSLIRELSGLLEEVVGIDEASGFISVVGQRIGSEVNNSYKTAMHVSKLTTDQIAEVLKDLKHRIQGDFYIIEANENKIVLGNRVCPFSDKVKDRPSLCMMTSNVFGTIASENSGYAKVSLEQTIAQGDQGCRVVVYLNESTETELADGREYYQTGE